MNFPILKTWFRKLMNIQKARRKIQETMKVFLKTITVTPTTQLKRMKKSTERNEPFMNTMKIQKEICVITQRVVLQKSWETVNQHQLKTLKNRRFSSLKECH